VTAPERLFGKAFDSVFAERQREADEFYTQIVSEMVSSEPRNVIRQGYAGLLWSKQFYHYIVADWLAGDSAQPPPPAERRGGRNREWESGQGVREKNQPKPKMALCLPYRGRC
jgi:hypothetical protein